jgi:D-alanyl-D-alanine carboxypeptidase
MEDGSGLSHFNAVSPAQINSILIYMEGKSENREVFFIHYLPLEMELLNHLAPILFLKIH